MSSTSYINPSRLLLSLQPEKPRRTHSRKSLKMSCPASTTTTVDQGGEITISAVHSDILLTHILTRLDGPTLASASCASSQIRTLSTEENLWINICNATWPSTNHPRMHQLISKFPTKSRSFFSDTFPSIASDFDSDLTTQNPDHPSIPPPPQLISAVDLHYKNNLIFSKVHESETLSSWFQCSPFRIDLLDPKDVVPTPIRHINDMCRNLEEDLKLTWIIIDPTSNRAANLSSWTPVSVQRHWLSKEIQVRFATIMGRNRGSKEFIKCEVMVGFGGCEGGDQMQVREVSLKVEDMDGITLNGKDSLGILQRAIESGRRKKERREEGKERYEEYLKKKRERKERELRREGRLDQICMLFAVSIFSAFFVFVCFV